MPKFAYVGVTVDGNEVTGTQKAPSRGDAEVSLYERQLRHLRVTEKKERTTLRQYGIRSSTDLLDVCKDAQRASDMERLLNEGDESQPSRMRSLVVTLERERNLQYVEAWQDGQTRGGARCATGRRSGADLTPQTATAETPSSDARGPFVRERGVLDSAAQQRQSTGEVPHE